jgi:hypothetical protein
VSRWEDNFKRIGDDIAGGAKLAVRNVIAYSPLPPATKDVAGAVLGVDTKTSGQKRAEELAAESARNQELANQIANEARQAEAEQRAAQAAVEQQAREAQARAAEQERKVGVFRGSQMMARNRQTESRFFDQRNAPRMVVQPQGTAGRLAGEIAFTGAREKPANYAILEGGRYGERKGTADKAILDGGEYGARYTAMNQAILNG